MAAAGYAVPGDAAAAIRSQFSAYPAECAAMRAFALDNGSAPTFAVTPAAQG